MTDYEAIGVVELLYFTNAMEVLDEMCKASNVEYLTSEKYLGGKLVSVIVGGTVSNVTAAVQAAETICASKPRNPLKMAIVITKPHEEIMKFIVPAVKTEVKKRSKVQKAEQKSEETKEV